eukprot:CAMPEP_0174384772 /NCGR_PEP_ID=MMETSP0811_2-20130205/126140_1 /TAXON_ID=73025 ORGANISM="Eutreptiella gymnastica-like, Strain CCMP1594" /NCGR_SAMPLE_ID=MMETSP0811_2 /ASSEMBLY_ACC=CAM_ASM_000667 /LENGTH=73 /DNA_ID=CAMNT_0015538835 /DNA_START=1194 /DNA_END=1415 /DNA_ORIENTATION=+
MIPAGLTWWGVISGREADAQGELAMMSMLVLRANTLPIAHIPGLGFVKSRLANPWQHSNTITYLVRCSDAGQL